MKKHYILATAITAILASTSLATAQRGPEGAPSATPASPASPASPANPAAGEKGRGADRDSAKPDSRATSGSENRSGASQPSAADRQKNPTATSDKAQADDKGQKGPAAQQNRTTQSEGGASSPSKAQSPASSSERNASGGTQTNVNVNLSTQQRTQIRQTVIKESNAPRISRTEINFSLNVGTVVPRTVRVATLPAAVIQIHPAWRGYSYVLVGDEIVILEPGSLRIVAIIPA